MTRRRNSWNLLVFALGCGLFALTLSPGCIRCAPFHNSSLASCAGIHGPHPAQCRSGCPRDVAGLLAAAGVQNVWIHTTNSSHMLQGISLQSRCAERVNSFHQFLTHNDAYGVTAVTPSSVRPPHPATHTIPHPSLLLPLPPPGPTRGGHRARRGPDG